MRNFCLVLIISLGIVYSACAEEIRLKMMFNNETIVVRLFDNAASRDFTSLLPLTLSFSDYAGIEKTAYPPRKLNTQRLRNGGNGDFTYYAPWGNIAIFYKGNGGGEVIHLGKIESGKGKLAAQQGEFTARIERMD